MIILANYYLGTNSDKFVLWQHEILYQGLPNHYLICLHVRYSDLCQLCCSEAFTHQEHPYNLGTE